MLTKADRQAIVDDFVARHGRYDPAEFVAEAAGDNHPAHKWFTWDDEAAAASHRMWQARTFVSGLRVKFSVETIQSGTITIRETTAPAYVSPMEDRRKGGGGYVALAPSDPAAMASFCREASSALSSWLRRYEGALLSAGGSADDIRAQIAALDATTSAASETVAAE